MMLFICRSCPAEGSRSFTSDPLAPPKPVNGSTQRVRQARDLASLLIRPLASLRHHFVIAMDRSGKNVCHQSAIS